MGKPYDISREDLLADRTAFVHVYLMFVVYRTKGLKYNLFFLCVCVCVCVCISCCTYCNAYLFLIIFVGSKSSYELNNLRGDPLEIQHPKFMNSVEVVLRHQ